MPAAYVGAAAAAGSLALNVANSGGSGNAGVPNVYQPGNPIPMDINYQNIVGGMVPYAQQIPGALIPGLTNAAGNIQNNPYAPGAQTAANMAGGMAPGVAGMEFGGAGGLYGAASGAIPYASQILSSGFDPQSQLYNRMQQQVQDQLNATNAMNGIAGTPYGAGVMGQGLANWNIDWQNAQLQRQMQASQGYGNLTSAAGRGFAGASDLGTAGMGTLASGGAIPYSTYLGQQGDVISGLSNVGTGADSAFQLPGNVLNSLAA